MNTTSLILLCVPRNDQNTFWWCFTCTKQLTHYIQYFKNILYKFFCVWKLPWTFDYGALCRWKVLTLPVHFRHAVPVPCVCINQQKERVGTEYRLTNRVSLDRIRDMRWRGVVQRFYWHLLETVSITPLTSPFMRLCGSPKLMLIKQSPSHSIW